MVDRGLSGRANLELHARLWGVAAGGGRPAHRRARRGRSASQRCSTGRSASYSGGAAAAARDRPRARVRAARACSSTSRPSGSTRASAHELLDVIAGLRAREEMTILLTTHYLDEAQRLCDRVAIVHLGEIVGLDTPRGAARRPRARAARAARRRRRRRRARRAPRRAASPAPTRSRSAPRLTFPLHAAAAPPRRSPRSTTAGLPVSGARRPAAPRLDDVYLRLTGDQLADAA